MALRADNGDIRTLRDMIFQNLIKIQLIDSVAGSNNDIGLMAFLQPLYVLVDSICSASVPPVVRRCHGRSEDIQASLLSSKIPPLR